MSILSLAITDSAPAPIRAADYGAPTTITPLDTGTVWAVTDDGALLAIWYLDASALLSTVRSGELTARVLRLRDTVSAWAYLIIGGALTATKDGATNHNGMRTGWPWASLQGALLAVQEAGVSVISVYGAEQVPALIQQLAAARRGAAKRVRPPRDVLFFSPIEDMLLALPGIGPKHLDALLGATGNNGAMALCTLTDPTITVPSVPRRVQEDARRALGLPADMRLGLDTIPTEEAINEPTPSGAAATNGHGRADQLAAALVTADA